MKNILLVLSTTRQSPKTIDAAFEKAKEEKRGLTALFVLDSEMPESIFEKLTDIGFTGEKPSQQLHDSILAEYRVRGDRKLKELGEMARTMDVSFKTIIREGDFTKECLSVIGEEEADFVIITRKKRSSLSRFIFGSALAEINDKTHCEMLIIDE